MTLSRLTDFGMLLLCVGDTDVRHESFKAEFSLDSILQYIKSYCKYDFAEQRTFGYIKYSDKRTVVNASMQL